MFRKKSSILYKVLIFIPIALISLILLSYFSYSFSKSELETQITEKMTHINNEVIHNIDSQFIAHQRIGESIAALIEATGTDIDQEGYAETLKHAVQINEDTFGTGVWFEPYQYDEERRYFGPYVYEDNGQTFFTDEYESAQYDYHSHEWYQVGREQGTVVWTEPYYDETLDMTMITTTIPFYDQQGSFLGVVTSDIDITNIQNLVMEIETVDEGWAFLVGEGGEFIAHADQSKVMQATLHDEDELGAISSELMNNESGMITTSLQNGDSQVFYQEIPRTGWKLALVVPEDEAYAPLNTLLNQILIVSSIIIISLVIVGFIIGKRLIKPIVSLNKEVNKLANGDLSVTIKPTTNDEIGQLTTNFNEMVQNIRDLIQTVKRSVNTVSHSSDHLSAISEETTASSEEVNRAIEEIVKGTNDTASYAEDTNQSTLALSDQIDQLKKQTDLALEKSSKAHELNDNGMTQVQRLKEKSDESNSVIDSVGNTVEGLSSKVKEIQKVIQTINDISDQTNLLALNASIEAARAGEAGKGFAVVADEVRKLAEETSNATDLVRDTLKGIQTESDEALNKMVSTKEIVSEQNQFVENTETSFKEISMIIDEMTTSITSASKEINEVNEFKENVVDAIQNILSLAQESSAACEQVNASSDEQLLALQSITDSAEKLKHSSEDLVHVMNRFTDHNEQESN
ncbi:methyl-accepting chemotaxis protein [Bacillus shivajii]|uniref:methyl-accepting chemotaxis protein n=1 Tax=Bacillus shivajii TaxID=1983719 RepID=UPI001CF961C7|nr:methyl-accepting chemotaxis protein [Bacillus shivajii]UCZ53768.1 methyl-accepting chemotaxis protein [Bacillus shivajii]